MPKLIYKHELLEWLRGVREYAEMKGRQKRANYVRYIEQTIADGRFDADVWITEKPKLNTEGE